MCRAACTPDACDLGLTMGEEYTHVACGVLGKVILTLDRSRKIINHISSVQSLSGVRLFATPWTAAHQASLSITNLCCLSLIARMTVFIDESAECL